MDKRRPMDQLNRDCRMHETVRLRGWNTRGETYQQRPQPLPAGGDRVAGVARQSGTVIDADLRHATLDAIHDARHGCPRGIDDGLYRLHGASRDLMAEPLPPLTEGSGAIRPFARISLHIHPLHKASPVTTPT